MKSRIEMPKKTRLDVIAYQNWLPRAVEDDHLAQYVDVLRESLTFHIHVCTLSHEDLG